MENSKRKGRDVANSLLGRSCSSLGLAIVLSAVGLLSGLLHSANSFAQRAELSPATSCSEIVAAIKRLAAAEHEQAQALQLMARGGSPALVEQKLQILLERKRALQQTLKRISADPVAEEKTVDQCLSNGYQALYQSERLTANIERILMGNRFPSSGFSPLSDLGSRSSTHP